tara:strand:+ start:447 stop:1253 length:807 start_codon:yes stop_codon:yes gene_type:complete
MSIVGIIPTRMASSRFPGKPLANINGIPMIGHVYYRSKMAGRLNDVYVATCDHEISDYIRGIGGEVIMTSSSHERASDRVAEAMPIIEKKTREKIDIVVLIQGDEPMVLPEMIELAVQPLMEEEEVTVSNLMANIGSIKEFEDPNEVKVVVDNEDFALYFSREPIPSLKKHNGTTFPMRKQVCIIPFTRQCIIDYMNLAPTPLETIESIDMLRFLEHGKKIKMVLTSHQTFAVDTESDLKKVETLMKDDPLLKKYQNDSSIHSINNVC